MELPVHVRVLHLPCPYSLGLSTPPKATVDSLQIVLAMLDSVTIVWQRALSERQIVC